MIEFINASDLKFVDLDSEAERTYVFKDQLITIVNPLKLNVSKTGGHRIFDVQGISHYIPAGWRHLHWKVKPGKPHFDF